MRRLLVDSGAWIAVASARDGRHAEADRLLREALARKLALVTTNLIVAEVHRFVLFRLGAPAAASALDRIDRSPSVAIRFATEAHHRAARAWLAKLADQQLSYTDAVSFAVMETERCDAAFSFDRDFVVAGFRVWGGGR